MLRSIFALLFALVAVSANAGEEQRFALVIGNAAYQNVEALENPINDANDLASALKRMGFDVSLGLDLGRIQLQQTIEEFALKAQDADLSLIYFAGHGIELDQTNFLIPVDAKLERDNDAEAETVTLDALMASVAKMRGIKVVLIDACRNNPFADRLRQSQPTRSIGIGLVRVDPLGGVLPDGVLIGYAAKEGTVAFEGLGRNSPYAQGLLQHIEEPGLEIGKLFRRVRDSVFRATNGAQQPFTYGSLPSTDIFLVPDSMSLTSKEQTDADEVALFEAAKELGTPRAWELYFGRYPNGARRAEALQLEAAIIRQELQYRGSGRDLSTAKPIEWMRREAVSYLNLSRAQQLSIQVKLQRFGYSAGTTDGVMGPVSFAALANFQRDRQLLADGVLDRATLSALEIDPANSAEGWFPVAATLGKRYDANAITTLEPDARVLRLVETFPGRAMNYGFYEGRLYAVVRPRYQTWDQTLETADQAGGRLATIGSKEEETAIVRLFQYDSSFWSERKERDLYSFDGDDTLDVVGPTFGLSQSDERWSWIDGTAMAHRNWMPGFPKNHRPMPYADFVHGPRPAGALPTNWRWGNWHRPRNAIVIEVE